MNPEIEPKQEDDVSVTPELEQPIEQQPELEEDKQSDLDVPGGKGLVKE